MKCGSGTSGLYLCEKGRRQYLTADLICVPTAESYNLRITFGISAKRSPDIYERKSRHGR